MKSILLLALTILLLGTAQLVAQDGDKGLTFDALRRRLDTDLDGRISPSEFPRGPAAFRRLDRDHDGFLTAADFGPRAAQPADAKQPERVATAEETEFFEKKIRPVLASACYSCHSDTAPKLKGGLHADSRAALLAGGSSGAAIVPGDVEASLLVKALRYDDPDLAMPPKKALASEVVKDFEHWVSIGAPWPADAATTTATTPNSGTRAVKAPIDLAKAREFWSFRAPVRTSAPIAKAETKYADWAWSEIDRFLLAAMTAKGVAPVADANKHTWLRRVTFDLTGLPPTLEEQAAFDADRSAQAFEKAVDRLLASTAYGERFGRHWLDVARYAESSGKDTNVVYPHAWRYRDWVIAAFNADKPYDQFLKEQLAGDLLPSTDDDRRAQNLIATGYLAIGAKSHNTRDKRQFALDVADEQIDAVSQGMLGMTMACARCHDHKFDPIPTEDYYALAGIFLSTDTRFGTRRGPGNNQPGELIALPANAHVPNGPTMDPFLRKLVERGRDTFAKVADESAMTPRTKGEPGVDDKKRPDAVDAQKIRVAREQVAIFDDLLARFDMSGRALDTNRLAMGVVEGMTRDIAVLERGEVDKPAAIAPRQMPIVFRSEASSPIKSGSGRRELADWIASSANPLTARVWVNRIWLHLFGTGIVRTPENFGASGQRPDHPELLDWLATELVEKGWSTKKLVREIVLSHAYRLDSATDARWAAIDPEAVTLWRMPARRLEAESIRDALLAISGTLQREPPVGSPTGTIEGALQREELLTYVTRERPVRSVYLPSLRDHLPEALEVFDAPDPSFVTGDREETNVATQALFLMNDDDVMKIADAFADRIIAGDERDPERIQKAFLLAFSRLPSAGEDIAVRQFLSDFEKLAQKSQSKKALRDERPNGRDRRDRDRQPESRANVDPRRAAWSAFAQSLFESAEFRSNG